MPNYNVYATNFWNEDAFLSGDKYNLSELYRVPTTRITWIARCPTNLDDGIPQDFFDMSLCWFQQHRNAKIWRDMTIVPTNITSEVSTMMTLYSAYVEARVTAEDADFAFLPSINSLKEKLRKMKQRLLVYHISHPVIDEKRLMESSTPVIEYVLQNKELSKKQYIVVVAAQDFDNCSWSGIIAMNSLSLWAIVVAGDSPLSFQAFPVAGFDFLVVARLVY